LTYNGISQTNQMEQLIAGGIGYTHRGRLALRCGSPIVFIGASIAALALWVKQARTKFNLSASKIAVVLALSRNVIPTASPASLEERNNTNHQCG
jgi:hypothetical protein